VSASGLHCGTSKEARTERVFRVDTWEPAINAYRCEKDLVDVPEEAKQSLKFVPVENVDEVLAAALEKDSAAKPASADEAGGKGKD
jgi:Lon protease (S16) C-terminal proteolytic domain